MSFSIHPEPRRCFTWVLCVVIVSPIAARAADPEPLGPPFEIARESLYEVDGVEFAGFGSGQRMAGDPSGNFVVSWPLDFAGPGPGAVVRRFGVDGVPFNPWFNIADDGEFSDGGQYAYQVGVASDQKGNFIVSWVDSRDDPDGFGYYAFVQRFSPKGTQIDNRLVLTDSALTYYTDITADAAGNFVVAWSEDDLGGNCAGDVACVVARRGSKASFNGAAFKVNTDPFQEDNYFRISVGIEGEGNFLVAWRDDNDGLLGRIFEADGTPVGAQFTVGGENEYFPSVVGLPSGGFMVASSEYDYGAHVRTFDATGAPGLDFLVGPTNIQEVTAAGVGSNHFVLAWSDEYYGAVAGQLFQNDGTPEGSEFELDPESYGPSLAATGRGDGKFAISWDAEYLDEAACPDEPCGLVVSLMAVPEAPEEFLLPGKKLVLKNKIPDNPEKNQGVWSVGGAVQGPEPGGHNDPRCFSNPPGTVKAWIRFVSQTSGHDSGFLPLPCQHWLPSSPFLPSRSFQYKDKLLADGPCGKVKIKDGKSITVTCKGKSGVASFPYDLVPGIAEGAVDVALRIGSNSYCTSFPPFAGKDGSDGKSFLGKNAPAPAGCPPGSPP